MNGTELALAGGLLLALVSVIIVALKRHLDYRYIWKEAKALEKECQGTAYFAAPEAYDRNYRKDESEFIFSSVEFFRSEDGKSRPRIRLTMAFLQPEDRLLIEPVVRECAFAKINSAERGKLFVHLYTTLSSE